MSRVVVISGYYRRKDALEQTVRSIIAQSYRDWELIVFDDHSNDGSEAELERLQHELKDNRFRYTVFERNMGFTNGLVSIINSTDSEFVAIQGSGDLSLPQRLEKQVAAMDADGALGLVGSLYENLYDDGRVFKSGVETGELDYLDKQRLLKRHVAFTHGTCLHRRSAYETAGGYRPAFVFQQDHDLELRVIDKARIATLGSVLYRRYVRADGVTYSPDKFMRQEKFGILTEQMAESTPKKSQELYASMVRDGPDALIGNNHFRLQRRLKQAAIRAAVKGHWTEVQQLYAPKITSRLWRSGIGFTAQICRIPAIAKIMGFAYRSASLRRLFVRVAT